MRIKLSNIEISHIATGLPSKVVRMTDYAERFGDKDVKRIMKSTGVKSVHVAEDDMCTSDYLVAIASRLMQECGYTGADFDALVLVSQTPDYVLPSTSTIMQDRLGLPQSAVTFDINFGCSGYIYGLYQASLLVSSGSCQRVLLCVGETNIRTMHPEDRANRMVLGDGFAVTVVEKGTKDLTFHIYSDGSGYPYLIMEAGGFRLSRSPETAKPIVGEDGDKRWPDYLYMNGMEIMNFALGRVPKLIEEVLSDVGWSKEDVGIFAMHQANKLIVDFLARRIGVDSQKMPVGLEDVGNTVSASVPQLLAKERLADHDWKKSILCGFGIGLSWGAVATDLSSTAIHETWEFSREDILPFMNNITV